MKEQKKDLDSQYIHGTHVPETERLEILIRLLNEASLRELALQGDERILEVGCGHAQFAIEMFKQAGGSGFVLGIERSAEQLQVAKNRLIDLNDSFDIELRSGDAQQLPLQKEEWQSFDIAHARFLLEHVPDPLQVVREMFRAVKPGGRIILEDDDHDLIRLHPEPAGFAPMWRAYMRVYDRLGNDPYIGRRLIHLLYKSGATPVKNTWLFFGSCAGNPKFKPIVQNLIGLFKGAREKIINGDLLNSWQFDETIKELEKWEKVPYAAFWFAVPWAEGIKPLQ